MSNAFHEASFCFDWFAGRLCFADSFAALLRLTRRAGASQGEKKRGPSPRLTSCQAGRPLCGLRPSSPAGQSQGYEGRFFRPYEGGEKIGARGFEPVEGVRQAPDTTGTNHAQSLESQEVATASKDISGTPPEQQKPTFGVEPCCKNVAAADPENDPNTLFDLWKRLPPAARHAVLTLMKSLIDMDVDNQSASRASEGK